MTLVFKLIVPTQRQTVSLRTGSFNGMDYQSLNILLAGVKSEDRKAQKALYEHFYAYAKSICLRYSSNQQEAVEILNDGFLKVFHSIDIYNSDYPFKSWLRTIMIHKAIDYYRKTQKHVKISDLQTIDASDINDQEIESLELIDDIIPLIQQISPAYRNVLNLFVFEDYSHEEIAHKLQISASTSRSNLSRAIGQLKQIINEQAPHIKLRKKNEQIN